MRTASLYLALFALAASALHAQSPCSTTPNLNVTGTWYGYASDGVTVTTKATLTQTGSTWSGTYNDTPVSGHGSLTGSFLSGTVTGGNMFDASLSVTEVTTVTGTVTFTLTSDGNHLNGSYIEPSLSPDSLPFNLVRVPPPILAPSIVTLNGTPGGMAVQDTTSLALYNCGGGPIDYSLAAASNSQGWLAVANNAGATCTLGCILPGGTSTALMLTATPGALGAAGSPYTGMVTVSPLNSGDFSPISAGIQFVLGTKDTVTVGNLFPPVGANLEFNTVSNNSFSVTVSATLDSASTGTMYMQVVDALGNQLGASPAVTLQKDVAINNKLLTASVTIPGTTLASGMVTMEVVVQPQGGAEDNITVATYTVYPHAKLTVATASGLWSQPASPPPNGVGVALDFMQGSPDRGTKVQVTVDNQDAASTSAGTIPPVDVSAGSGYYAGLANPAVITSGSTGLSTSVDMAVAMPLYLDDITQSTKASVSAPPTFTSFQLAGSDGNFVDSSTASILGAAGGEQRVIAKVTYTGLDSPVCAELDAANGAGLGSITAAPGNQTQLSWDPPPDTTPSAQTFSVTFTNGFGQVSKSNQSAAMIPEFVHITSLQLDSSGKNVLAGIDYLWAGSQSLNAYAYYSYNYLGLGGVGSPSPIPGSQTLCIGMTTVSTVQHVQCTIPIGTLAGPLVITVHVFDAGSNGVERTAIGGAVDLPEHPTLAANTSTPVGPMTITAANSASTTANQYPDDLGGDFVTINIVTPPGTPAFRSATARPAADFNALASAGIAGTPAQPGSLAFLGSTMNFSPAAPNDQSQIVYSYSPADLPDDPGFNAANLELVSYDPASGKLLTYPSTVDTNAQTVTATASGLAPNFTLGVPASTVVPELILPFDPQGMPAPGGFALFNAGAGSAKTTLIARGNNGTALAAQPTIGETVPGQQISATLDSLGTASVMNPGWVQASTDSPGMAGVALLANLSSLESLPLTPGSIVQVLTGIEMAAGESTQLAVANATPFANVVTFDLYSTTGKLVDSEQVNLTAKQSFLTTVEEFFNAQAPFEGYVLVGGTERLTASSVTSIGNAVSALPGQPGLASATSLYAPHFQTGPSMAARLDIVNPGSVNAPVTIQFNKDDGTLLAKSITTTIAAGTQYWIDLATTLGLSATQFATGSISVSSSVAGLVGDVTFGDTSPVPNMRTSIPLMPAQTMQAVPYVLNTTALPMSVYAVNTGTSSANVTFTLYSSSGSVAGKATSTIVAGGRLEQPLSTLIAASAGQTGGALEIDSNQPLSAAGLIYPALPNGDWAAIAAQPSSLVPTGPIPLISAGGISNAAVAKTTLARGGLATIYGSNFTTGGNTYQGQTLPLPLNLGGVFVTVGGISAPLYYINSTQINYQVPFNVPAGSTASVIVTVNGVSSAPATVAMADYALGIFSYFRTATVYDPIIVHYKDNSFVTPSNPAVPGETLLIYATGIGKLSNPPPSGAGAPSGPLAQAVDTPTITVGGAGAQVLFAGLTPGSVGLAQFDVTLPANLPSGSLPLIVNFPGDVSPTVYLYVQGNQSTAPQLSLSTSSLSFGNVTVGSPAIQTFTIGNPGFAPLAVSSITASAGFSVVSPSTPFSVAAGGSQVVTIRFAPTGAGAVSGTLSIANNAGAAASVSLSGTGVAAGTPAIGVSVTSLSFGSVTVGQSANQTFTVSNTGAGSLTVNSIAAAAGSGFSLASPSTPFSVAAGTSTTVTIAFAPTGANSYSSTLTISSTDPNRPSVTISLSGTGAPSGSLACGFTLSAGIYAKWTSLGGSGGILGCPTANEKAAPASPQGSTGSSAPFVNGIIYLHATGPFAGRAYEMHSCTPTTYAGLGLSSGAFGFPTSDQYAVDLGFRNDFQGGYIVAPSSGFITCSSFAASLDFSGVWSTDRGTLIMDQESLDVSGTYSSPSGSLMSANPVANSSFGFGWVDTSGTGSGTFTLAADRNSFTGTYTKTPSPAVSQWNGTRTSGGSVGWFTPSVINFGAVTLGSSSTLNLVAQASVEGLSLQTFTASNPAFLVNAGSLEVLPSNPALLPIRFTPTAAGPVSATITITTGDAARPQVTIQVTGTGQ